MIKHLVILFLLILTACQKSAVNDLQEAQLCLDHSAAADAMNCVAKIASDTSENAYKLKCSAVFISEGFNTPASFTGILDQLTSPTNSHGCVGDCSSTLAAMNIFKFSSGDNTQAANRQKNNDTAAEAFSYCSSSGVKIYTQISSLFKLGTMLAMVTPSVVAGGSSSTADLQAAVSSLPSADVGNVVITAYQQTCTSLSSSASDSMKQYCSELGTAFSAGATATSIGDCLKGRLADPSYVCP